MIEWFPRWDRCAIVASGPSAIGDAEAVLASGWPVIAVNESWRLVPDADALYGCDYDWWKLRDGVPEFKGLKISQDEAACARFPDLKRVYLRGHEFILEPCGHIGGGGNGGFQALNLAAQFGCRRVALVGFDMQGGHWHGDHPAPLGNPGTHAFGKMIAKFDAAAPALLAAGIDVVNCSASSALTCFRKAGAVEALRGA